MANYTLLPVKDETERVETESKPSAVAETESKSSAVVETESKLSTAVEKEMKPSAVVEKEMKPSAGANSKKGGAPPLPIGWTVDGVPAGEPSVGRARWESGIFSCTGKKDEFYSSDVEVCLLGSVAPCVLHGSNVERLGSTPGSFTNHCLPYAGLYILGNCIFGWNCLAPWYSYPNRRAIRHKFNLEGSCESLARTFGCSGNILMTEAQREQCESACDFATHVFCHPCALCQEAREVRRKVPHPGLAANPVFVMLPPGTQTMTRQP